MSVRHDHLHEALETLLGAVARRDAEGARAAIEEAARRFAATPSPGDDDRLRPLLAACESAARTFHGQLASELRESVVSARAHVAYATGGRKSAP